MRSILILSMLLSVCIYPLLAYSRAVAVFESTSYTNDDDDDDDDRRPIFQPPRHKLEVWSATPSITCSTTSDSPRAFDVLAIAHSLVRYAPVIRVSGTDGKAWTSGEAAVGVSAAYGVRVPAVTPVRAVKMLLYRCRKRIAGVERVGGRADFVTGVVVDVYRVA